MQITNWQMASSLRHFRTAARITRQQVQSLTGIRDRNLGRMEDGSRMVTIPTLSKLAATYGVTEGQIIEYAKTLPKNKVQQLELLSIV